jgi:ArsR family transcriptional regulator
VLILPSALTEGQYLAKLPNSVTGEAADMGDRDRLEQRARILKAMAHPSRLLMIETLAEGERCVCDLQAQVGADISTVSKHLAVLKQAGLVSSEKRGLQVFYRLLSPCVMNFFSCVESVIEAGDVPGDNA